MEDLQQKVLQFQTLQQNIEQISEQLQMMQRQMEEIEISKEALIELENTAVGKEMLCPIANGIFIQTGLQNNEKLVVNVGANVTVEKTVPEVIKLLDEQRVSVREQLQKGEAVLNDLHEQAMKIYQEVEK
jgi:prefoldin alpha subunit